MSAGMLMHRAESHRRPSGVTAPAKTARARMPKNHTHESPQPSNGQYQTSTFPTLWCYRSGPIVTVHEKVIPKASRLGYERPRPADGIMLCCCFKTCSTLVPPCYEMLQNAKHIKVTALMVEL